MPFATVTLSSVCYVSRRHHSRSIIIELKLYIKSRYSAEKTNCVPLEIRNAQYSLLRSSALKSAIRKLQARVCVITPGSKFASEKVELKPPNPACLNGRRNSLSSSELPPCLLRTQLLRRVWSMIPQEAHHPDTTSIKHKQAHRISIWTTDAPPRTLINAIGDCWVVQIRGMICGIELFAMLTVS